MKNKLVKLLDNSYSPYSSIKVSSIVVMKNGTEFKGVNVENAAYGPTICAERSAIVSAISNGFKKNDFKELHLTSNTGKMLYPCGVCRQVMSEFFAEDVNIYIYNGDQMETETISRILPNKVTKESF